jgi:hypothetical protein
MKTCIALAIIVLFAACSSTNSNGVDAPMLTQSRERMQEQSLPLNYLILESDWKENMIGRKVFTGSIANNALHTTFEQVYLTFHFFDSTGVKTSERSFACVDELLPGKVHKFKIKTYAPLNTQTYTCTVKAKGQK